MKMTLKKRKTRKQTGWVVKGRDARCFQRWMEIHERVIKLLNKQGYDVDLDDKIAAISVRYFEGMHQAPKAIRSQWLAMAWDDLDQAKKPVIDAFIHDFAEFVRQEVEQIIWRKAKKRYDLPEAEGSALGLSKSLGIARSAATNRRVIARDKAAMVQAAMRSTAKAKRKTKRK